jgi:hypothetical protein
VTRAEFCNFTPDWLVRECYAAAEIGKHRETGGTVNRPSLVRNMSAELGILWSSEVPQLPPEEDANYGPDSPAARRFRRQLEEIMCGGVQFEVEKTALGTSATTTHAARTSIIERIRDQSRPYTDGQAVPGKREGWRRVQKAFDCWWKPVTCKGEVVVVIALRWRVGFQQKPQMFMPGVHDQASFRRQCDKSGLSYQGDKMSARLQGKGDRLVILSQRFTRYLLALPRNRHEEPKPGSNGRQQGTP